MKYYIIENEAPTGPFEVEELVARGLRPTDLVWTEGMSDWATAESVEEVRCALYGPKNVGEAVPTPPVVPPCPPPTPQPQYQQPQYQQPQYQQPQYQQPQYQQPQQPQQQAFPPDNGLAWAIIVTLFCCLPFGIVAIVKAASVNSLWNSGQYDQAYQAAAAAKKWSIVSAVVGVLGGLVYAGLAVFGGLMEAFG